MYKFWLCLWFVDHRSGGLNFGLLVLVFDLFSYCCFLNLFTWVVYPYMANPHLKVSQYTEEYWFHLLGRYLINRVWLLSISPNGPSPLWVLSGPNSIIEMDNIFYLDKTLVIQFQTNHDDQMSVDIILKSIYLSKEEIATPDRNSFILFISRQIYYEIKSTDVRSMWFFAWLLFSMTSKIWTIPIIELVL